MLGAGKQPRISNTGSTRTTEDDNTPPPLEDLRMADLSDNLENNSLSDFGEDDDDDEEVENLQEAAAKETRKSLARTETKAVSCLRYVVLMVLMATAIGVSVGTFFYSRGVERESFRAEFESVAAMTLRSFAEAVEHKLAALDVLAAGVTSHALESGETFPNVTVPHWEVKAAQVRTQTDGIYAFYLPLVTDETRAGYEAYTQMKWKQIISSYMAEEGMRQYQDKYFGIEPEETKAADAAAEKASGEEEAKLEAAQAEAKQHSHGDGEQHSHNGDAGRLLHAAPPEIHPTIHDGIWGLNLYNGSWIEPEGTGPYLPMWQLSPIIPMPGIVNYNFLAYYDLAPVMRQTLNTGKAGLSYIQTNHTGSNTADLIRIFMTLNQYRHENIDYQEDPLTQVTYPVFDTFSPWKRQVSGMVITTIFWRLLFANILPESVKGVVCVLSNTLGESITYQINGREVIFLGTGDLHDDKYNHMGVFRDIAQYLKERAGPQTQAYTTVELDGGYTSYQIYVYPSQTMEDTYITTDPILYAVVVASIFLFTSMVFLLYDWIVERRQAKVMDKAVKSTAVVTSLFPKAVHERLFADAPSAEMSREIQNWRAASAQLSLPQQQEPTVAELMRRSGGSLAAPDLSQLIPPPRNSKIKGKPIADKFPECTVYFADLAGFTKWSSTREPEHVFILLETLYGAFDKVALRRGVFKVETIGDCYMAATGLPNPQPDHAVRMVKFARDCMTRMQRLVGELSVSLGMDTKELAMRVGLHSGPVTAGVLRGDKGRFQLFGDTVNTASRMESNGVKGRIHISESTAKHLPDKWLKMREDKIVAKGKGEMTTYFVDAGNGARSSLASAAFDSMDSGEDEEDEDVDDSQTLRDMSFSARIARYIEDSETARDLDASNISASIRRISDGTSASLHRISIDSHMYHDYEEKQFKRTPFEDEPRRREIPKKTADFSPMDYAKSIADRLGISDEVEV